ncbi:MAG TPA: ParB/RepB/Spo0J family partition protein [Candidatus Paceibacterota bacterium]|nr:ParB/RepB/Spo0J family partition protein [Candidatus Paceibacterota bacterium]HRZ55826.1 ParB/RepB/Spo0J family partition protein [Candidatus Paceibacterota bacterium]
MATSLRERLARQANGELHLPLDPVRHDEPRLVVVPLDLIERDPEQPRKDLGDLTELAESIREQGVVQPLIVEPIAMDRFRLLAGERRHAACKLAGLHEAPCIVRTVEDHSRLALQLIENLHHKPLTPIEEATAYRRLLEEFNLTQRELAQRLGKSLGSINQTLRLLDLSPEVQADVRTSEPPSKSVLLEIAKEPDGQRQSALLKEAQAGRLTVRAAKQRKQATATGQAKKTSKVHAIELTQATVTIRFHQGEVTQAGLIAVLEEALARTRSA